MAKVLHTCSGCVPIDVSIIDVYTQLISASARAEAAAKKADEASLGKAPYVGENGNWWEWDEQQKTFVDTGIQAETGMVVDDQMSDTSTYPVQNKVVKEYIDEHTASDPDAVKYTEQLLTPEQKSQARTNIGAGTSDFSGSYNDLSDKPVIPTVPTISTDISADATSDTKTASPKAVKDYVDAHGGGGSDPEAVKYTAQSLTDSQKAQARTNIGAQEMLVGSGTGQNIKTINQTSILGSGDIVIPKGDTGATPKFSIGTVQTGAAGSQASASITGTAAAPVLNLVIPKGDQGNTGSSVDYPYELVNNLTTDDATKGLSAAQGVVLAQSMLNIFPIDAKQILVSLLKKLAYLDSDVAEDVSDLEYFLLTDVHLSSLSVVFNQGTEEFYEGESIEDLREYIVVTGTYDDTSTREITNYTLAGELSEGTSTITVSYGGKATTFTVSVTDAVYYRDGGKMIRPYFLNSANQNYGPATVGGVTLVYTRSKNSSNVVQVSRACYPYFDLLLTSGKDYKWTVKATGLPTGCKISAGIQYFNQSFKTDGDANLLANHSADQLDSGWLNTTINDGVIAVTYGSETESSALTLIGARLNLRLLDSSDQDISWPNDCVIEKLIIQEVE